MTVNVCALPWTRGSAPSMPFSFRATLRNRCPYSQVRHHDFESMTCLRSYRFSLGSDPRGHARASWRGQGAKPTRRVSTFQHLCNSLFKGKLTHSPVCHTERWGWGRQAPAGLQGPSLSLLPRWREPAGRGNSPLTTTTVGCLAMGPFLGGAAATGRLVECLVKGNRLR